MASRDEPSDASNQIDILVISSDDDDANSIMDNVSVSTGNLGQGNEPNLPDRHQSAEAVHNTDIQQSSKDIAGNSIDVAKNTGTEEGDRKRKAVGDEGPISNAETSEPLVTTIHNDRDADSGTKNGADSIPKRRRFLGHNDTNKIDPKVAETIIKQEATQCTRSASNVSVSKIGSQAHIHNRKDTASVAGAIADVSTPEAPENSRYLLFEHGDNERLALLRILAAESSRLPPFKMTSKEMERLPEALGYPNLQKTFVNIRNFVLSLWYENCHEELMLDVAKERAELHQIHVPLLGHIFRYLERAGFINFGVFARVPRPLSKQQKRKVIVVGAGIAGLATARQLQHFGFNVVVLEGRDRIGGRVATFEWGNYRAEMGAMVITGLGAGNPLHTLARQTNMKLHIIKNAHICPLYDHQGKLVTQSVDDALQNEFNVLLESTKKIGKLAVQVDGLRDKRLSLGEAYQLAVKFAEHRHQEARVKPLEQMKACLERLNAVTKALLKCREQKEKYFAHKQPEKDSSSPAPDQLDSGTAPSSGLAASNGPVPSAQGPREQPGVEAASPSLTQYVDHTSQTTGRSTPSALSTTSHTEHVQQHTHSAVKTVDMDALHEFEGKLILQQKQLNAERRQLSATFPEQYWSAEAKSILDWHVANLEFANATTIDNLSLEHWDQDDVHEFTGPHLTTKNGFSQLPNALGVGVDIRLERVVSKINYNDAGVEVFCNVSDHESPGAGVASTEKFEADAVVVTLPLGVLKENTVKFDPELPSWKTSVISRVGFGLLNKVILFFDKEFWTQHSDVWGYSSGPNGIPGEQYMFWSQLSATGRPSLLAINAGQAACASNAETDEDVVAKTVRVLHKIFGEDKVTKVLKFVVTRWETDPFARGSYSYMSVQATGKDYDTLALPITTQAGFSRVFFAGEHTIRDYPATVHGAFLSGVREAENIASKFDPNL
eukprot:m.693661 g.693661  ORF g.693661 m.693661 type:complete len:948 (+) comp22874_c0_seq1:141-2984(+)